MLGTPSRNTEVDFARDVIFKGLTLYGVTGRKMYSTWHAMKRFLKAGQFDPHPVVTHASRSKASRKRWRSSRTVRRGK